MAGVEVSARKGPSISVVNAERIEWRPLASAAVLPFTGTSFVAARDALVKAFGKLPVTLEWNEHGGILRGMLAASGEGNAPYDILYEALEKFGAIDLRET